MYYSLEIIGFKDTEVSNNNKKVHEVLSKEPNEHCKILLNFFVYSQSKLFEVNC